MIFGNTSIKRRVMQVINARIQQAQKAFDDACAKIEEDFEREYALLKTHREEAKEEEATTHVNNIIGKIN